MPKDEKYTAEQIIDAIKDTRGILSAAALKLRCHRSTIENYAKRYVTVADAIRQERETLVDIGETKLILAMEAGEAWAIMFLLRNLGKHRGYGGDIQLDITFVHREAEKLAIHLGLDKDEVLAEAIAIVRSGR